MEFGTVRGAEPSTRHHSDACFVRQRAALDLDGVAEYPLPRAVLLLQSLAADHAYLHICSRGDNRRRGRVLDGAAGEIANAALRLDTLEDGVRLLRRGRRLSHVP